MHKYRIEATKNGVTQSTVVCNDLGFDEMHERLWNHFNAATFYWGSLMVREPDFARVVEIENKAESQKQVNAS